MNIKIGDEVLIKNRTKSYEIKIKVKNLINRWDRISGEPYPVVVLENGHKFDATTGNAVTPQTGDYITKL